jgi:hypothetical protein
LKGECLRLVFANAIYDGQREVSLAKQGIAVAITEIDDVGAERETRRRRTKSGSTQSVDWRALWAKYAEARD